MWQCWRQNTTGNGSVLTCDRGAAGSRADTVRYEPLQRGVLVRWLRRTGLLGVLLAAALCATPAAAGGEVFTPIPARERGLQVDAALFSPQTERWPRPSDPASLQGVAFQSLSLEGQTYIVQSGDTLSEIAVRFDVDPAIVAARNGLSNPDHIEVGQSLILDIPDELPPMLAADPASGAEEDDLLRVQTWPWPPVQGQTLAVWLQARKPISFQLSLDGVPYPIVSDGRRGWALVPIPALTAPGGHLLAVTAGNTKVGIEIPIQAGAFDLYHIPASVSRPILDQGEKVRVEAEQLREVVSVWSPMGWTPRSRFESPLAGEYPRTSPYGSRRTYDPNPTISAHEGEDFSAPAGIPVIAPAPGEVAVAEPLFVRGNAVILNHGDGVFTGYWHLQDLAVQQGDHVETGQLLGRVGSTGLSTGAHLHWELRINGVAVDPLQWLEK